MGVGPEPITIRLIGGYADHSAISPRWFIAEVYAIRTKPGSFKGDNKSLHRIFAAALTRDPTAPELHRDFFSLINMVIAGCWRTNFERALHRQPK